MSLLEKLGIKPDENGNVSATAIEKFLEQNEKDAETLGYRGSQKVFVLATEPLVEPVTPQELMNVLADFYRNVSIYSEPMIKSLIERLESKGVLAGTAKFKKPNEGAATSEPEFITSAIRNEE